MVRTLVISYFFPPCTDGAATLMYNLCSNLPKNCYSVVTTEEQLGLYCWDNLGAYDKDFVLDCNITRLPVRTNRMHDRIKFFLLAILSGLLLNTKGFFDCILAVYPDEFDLYAGYVLSRLTRKPLVIYMHDLHSELKKRAHLYEIWKRLERRIFSSASAVLVTNEKFRDHYSERGIRNLVVLHSCIALQASKLRKLSETGPSRPYRRRLRIVFTGTVYQTNEDAILCFLEAAKKMEDIEIVFSTPSKKDYLSKVNTGFLSKKECLRLQRNADVLLLPLSFEPELREEVKCAFPCKVLEYLAAGKPILAIVPKESYMKEFIESYKVGLAITELSEEKMTNAILELTDERRREYFSGNAAKALSHFDARVQSKRLCSIIESVVQNRQLRD